MVQTAAVLLCCGRCCCPRSQVEIMISTMNIKTDRHAPITIVCQSLISVKTSQTPTTHKFSGRLHPTIISIICFFEHLVVLFIFANLNFRNVPHLFSFLSGAASAMNQPEAISAGLDSVRRYARTIAHRRGRTV